MAQVTLVRNVLRTVLFEMQLVRERVKKHFVTFDARCFFLPIRRLRISGRLSNSNAALVVFKLIIFRKLSIACGIGAFEFLLLFTRMLSPFVTV